jgi:hypothetical protein
MDNKAAAALQWLGRSWIPPVLLGAASGAAFLLCLQQVTAPPTREASRQNLRALSYTCQELPYSCST